MQQINTLPVSILLKPENANGRRFLLTTGGLYYSCPWEATITYTNTRPMEGLHKGPSTIPQSTSSNKNTVQALVRVDSCYLG